MGGTGRLSPVGEGHQPEEGYGAPSGAAAVAALLGLLLRWGWVRV